MPADTGARPREFASWPNLEAVLPLGARGGISYGFVVQRAGDIFGLPVNMSQALTTAARPGTVLLSADAATLIGPARRGRLRHRLLPHAALAEQRVATLHPPGQTSPPPGVQDGRPANA